MLVAMYGATAGQVGILKFEAATNQAVCGILPTAQVVPEYLYSVLKSKRDYLISLSSGGAQPNISQTVVRDLEFPLPPLEVQHQIVAEIEGYQKIIDGARQVLDNYAPRIPINSEWAELELSVVCEEFSNGANFSAEQVGRGTKFVNIKDVFSDGYIDPTTLGLVELSPAEVSRKALKADDLIFVRSSVKQSGVGYPSLTPATDEPLVFCGFLIKCRPNKALVEPRYLLWLLRTPDFRAKVVARSNRANITNISQDALKTLVVPVPDLETQRAIVAEIEAEQTLVNANRELVRRMEAKVKAAIDRVWGL